MNGKNIIVGIDVGGSTTKICGLRLDGGELITPQLVKASDPLASIYGAFGKFTSENGIDLSEVEKVMITGVGSSFVTRPLYGLPTVPVAEFKAIGLGGLYNSGFERAIVVSMGTGTAIVMAEDGKTTYLGGTGVGGGTLMGLSKKLLSMDSIENVIKLAQSGDLSKVDLRVGDITKKDILPGMPAHTTASNLGRISDLATRADIAMGVINLVFETIGMVAIFAARQYKISDIVLTGTLTNIPQAVSVFDNLNDMFKMNFVIPEYAQFRTVIGAALSYMHS
ncbi:MAG: type II pantothenate kinase [Eubacteriales bacterium]